MEYEIIPDSKLSVDVILDLAKSKKNSFVRNRSRNNEKISLAMVSYKWGSS
jgi:hypothetical protein